MIIQYAIYIIVIHTLYTIHYIYIVHYTIYTLCMHQYVCIIISLFVLDVRVLYLPVECRLDCMDFNPN